MEDDGFYRYARRIPKIDYAKPAISLRYKPTSYFASNLIMTQNRIAPVCMNLFIQNILFSDTCLTDNKMYYIVVILPIIATPARMKIIEIPALIANPTAE